MGTPQYLRRQQAAEYLKGRYGFGAARTLAKLAVVGGGPEIFYAGPRTPLYTEEKLDAWAQSKIGRPVRSTSERKASQKKLTLVTSDSSPEVSE
ncbi:hypothetical protein M2323_004043 [Rhodoblastus acidophilus]|uniref:hypothetical protein n=1 Tax=Rhodoblastus acidophilus TaxID=1074 RepID=UPI002225A7F6|nr:hypothetical protein [Rhodoblastus acidophilus]MCW2286218.1 hypothetical protein [Rhodoblastus acidophilus]MCW2335099.1 hypothetical protein [Rhodoblastus acidophilus]